MPRLDTFEIEIKTGENGHRDIPQYVINGFPLTFEHSEGTTESRGVLKATGAPQSFPHSLVLRGPSEGVWDIEETTITYYSMGSAPYTVRLGAVTLDHESDLNILHQAPAQSFDV